MIKLIMSGTKALFLSILLILAGEFVVGATRTASVTGNWSNTATWGGNPVPVAADAVIINPGITVTVDVPAVCTTFTFAAVTATTMVTISGTNSLTVSGLVSMPRPSSGFTCTIAVGAGSLTAGSLTMSANTGSRSNNITISTGTATINGLVTTGTTACRFTFTGAGLLRFGGTFSGGPAALTPLTGTVEYTGTSPVIQAFSGSYNNLLFSGTGTTSGSASGTLTIAGNLSSTAGGIFNFTSRPVRFSGTTAQSISGFTTTGLVSMIKTGGIATLAGNVNGAGLTINGTGGTLNLGTALTHTFTGTWTRTAGTLNGGSSTLRIGLSVGGTGGTFTAGTGTVEWYANAIQTIAGVVYYNLILSGTSTKTMTGVSTVSGNFTLSGTASASIAANFTLGGNLTIDNGTALTVPSFSFSVAGTSTIGGGSSGTLTLSSATGTKTFTGDVLVNGGTWSETAAAIINCGGSLQNNGSITASTGLHTFTGTLKSISGANAISIPTVTISGTYTNSATFTAGTALTVNNALTNNATITATTALSGSGTFTQGANSTLNIGGTSTVTSLIASASGNTVNYTGTAQSVSAIATYHHLTLSGSGIKTLNTSTTAINGVFTLAGTASVAGTTGLTIGGNVVLGSGTVFTAGTFTHTVGGDWTNNGSTFTPGSGTVNFNKTTADQNINGTSTTQIFNNLIVAKGTSNLVIGGSTTKVTIGLTLTMTSGNISTGTNTLELGSNTTTAGSLTYTSGSIVGNFKRWFNTIGSKEFPLGTSASSGTSVANRDTWVTFVNLTSGSITANFTASNPGSAGLPLSENAFTIENQFTEGYWSLVAGDGLASTNYLLTLAGTGFASYLEDADVRIIKRPNGGGSWSLDGTHTAATPPVAGRTGLSGFGEFAHGKTKPFPTVNFTSSSQVSATESGTMTITAQLSSPSLLGVSVPFTVDGSSTATGSGTDYSISASPITIPAGSTTGTVTITIVSDIIDEPNETVVINMGTPVNATQGSTITHTATITDDDNPPVVSFTTGSQSSINESGTMTLTAQLSVASSFNVTIPFTVNASSTATGGGVDYHISATPLIIPAGSTSANITITIDDDLLIEANETVIVNLGTPTNGTLGALTTHTATITDDEAPPTANFTPSSQSSLGESGTLTVTVQLSAVSTLNVSVPFTISGSSTATGGGTDYTISGSPVLINAGSTSGSITITITPDFLAEGNETIILNMGTPVNATSGATSTHSATITDDDTAGFTVSPTSGVVTDEFGDQGTFTVVLTSQPTSNVTISITSDDVTEGTVSPASLTFTSLNWNTLQTVTLTGVDDLVADGNIVYHIITGAAVSSDSKYSGLNPSDVTATNNDNDVAGFTVSPTVITTTEASGASHSATFDVRLNTQPTANVTIGLSSSNTGEGTVSPSSLTFTPSNWSTSQTSTVTGVDDFVDDGNVAYTIVTSAAASTDASYNNLDPANISATNINNDTKGITVSAISGTTTEAGGTATFTVVLNSQPTATVNIGISSSNAAEGTVSTSSLTFTTANWNTPQTVTVTGVDDFVADGPIPYTIITATATGGDYAGLNAADVTVTNLDNDTKGITVSAISGSTTEAGGTATFTVKLNSQPTASVSIGLSSSNTAEGTVSPSSLTFTTANWNTPQTVTTTGVNDFVQDGNITYSIITAPATGGDYATINAADVTVVNIDNDTAGFTVTPTSGLVTTEAGGAATFTIRLTSQPLANVTVGVSSNDLTEGTVPTSSLTFTTANWNTAQTVTVTGIDDQMVDGNILYTLVTAAAISTDVVYNGLNPSDVTVTNNDNDTAGITVSPTSGLITSEAGATASFTVVLTSQPSANVVIGLSSSDLTEGTVNPSSLTFTSSNWNLPQTVNAIGVDDYAVDGSIAYSIITSAATSGDGNYSGVNPTDVSVSNTDNDVADITVGSVSGNTTEAGGTATFTVVLTSQPSANVTIGVTSNDLTEGTVSASSLLFTSANWSTPQTVTITGVNDFIVDGNITYSVVLAAATSTDTQYNGINASDVTAVNLDNDTRGINVSSASGPTTEAGGTATFTIVLTTLPTASVNVGLSSDDTTEGTVFPASVTFTTANWNIPQTVTITGVDDFIQDGDLTYNIIVAAATGGDYAGINGNDVPIVNTDNDTADIIITPSGGTTSESGTSVTFSVVLNSQPVASVTFTVSSDDTSEGTVAPATLTFTAANWNVVQNITVTGVPDNVDDGNTPYNVTVSSSSADPNYDLVDTPLVMMNLDIDVAGFTILPLSGLVTTEAGGTASFTVKLNTLPAANVTFSLSSSNTAEGTVSPTSLTFTNANWSTNQTVTVTGVNDAIVDGDIIYAVISGAASSTDPNYSGLNPSDVSVTNTDLTPTVSSYSPSSVCQASGASVVITGTKFSGATSVTINGVSATFTVNSSTQITATLPSTATTGTIRVVTPTGTAISGTSLTVNPLPVASGTISGTATVCQGQATVPYSVSAITNATSYTWSYSGSGATITGTTNSVTITFSSTATSGNLTVYGVNTCGNGTVSANYAITVNPLPVSAGTITGTAAVCQGQNGVVYSIPAITNATGYSWSLPTGATIASGSNTRSVTVNYSNSAVSGNIAVYGTNGCGNGTPSAIYAVTVNPLPIAAGAISGSATVCRGQSSVSYTVPAITNATSYSWSYSGTGATITGTTNSVTISFSLSATSGNLTVYGVNSCGNGTVSANYAISLNPVTAISSQSTATQTVCLNGTFSAISVAATGTGTLTYQWYRNTSASTTEGSSLGTANGAQTSSYTPQATSAGTLYYYCIVHSDCGSNVTSSVSGAFITSPATVVSSQSTATQTTCINVAFTPISVTATGAGTLTYQWYQNTTASTSGGTPVSGATSSSYTPSAASAGTLYYYCIVTGTCTSATSSISGAFIVNPATAISGQSTSTQTVCINSAFSPISVTATGTGTLTYQWYSNTSAANTGGTLITGATSSSYTPLSTAAGTLYYYCIVHSNCGSNVTSSVSGAFITNPATAISSQSTATQTQCVTGTFTSISVTATGTGTLTYQWYSNAAASNSGGTLISGATGNSYIPSAGTVSTLYYYCIVHSNCGADVSSPVSGAFIVNPATSVSSQSTSTQTTCINGAFTAITVTASGTGPFTYQWYSNTTAANSAGTTLGATNGAQTSSYTPQALAAGTLYYYCVVTGTCASATSLVSGAFIVNPATAIPGQSTAAQTTCLTVPFNPITVTATGTGTLTYQWYSSATASNTGGTSLGSANGANTSSYTPQATIAGTLYYYCVVHGACGVDVTSAVSGVFTVINDLVWTGAVSTDWNTVGNWSCPYLPNLTTNVLIPSVTNKPVLSSGATGKCKNIVINTGSSLTVTGNILQIAETISNSGTFTASAGTIEMVGTAAQAIGANIFAGNTILNLTVSNSAGVTLAGPLSVTGVVKASTGNLSSGGNLTLVSTATQTALIDGAGAGDVTGNVTMQRYIPSAFGYKYVSSPFTAATVNAFAGYVNLAASFPTFYSYDENHLSPAGNPMSGWTKYTATSGVLSPLAGYSANFGSTPTNKTVSISGNVNNGSVQINLTNNNRTYTQGFNLVGNPYPSPIDWNAAGWSKSGVDNAIYFFNTGGPGANSAANDSLQYMGAYSSYVNGISSGVADNNIASMQGFFVHVTASGSTTLGATNSVRTTLLNPLLKDAVFDNRTILRFSANFKSNNATEDATVIYFDEQASQRFDKEKDALKLMNTNAFIPNIYSFSKDTKQISIKALPTPVDSLTRIPLGINTLSDGWVSFNARDISLLPPSLYIYLVDAEKKVTQNLKQLPEYSFYIKAGTYDQRFSLVFSLAEINPAAQPVEKMFTIKHSASILTITMNLAFNTRGSLYVTNVTGQIILRREVTDQETVEINPNSSSGLYIITVVSGNKRDSQKILIRKDYE